MRRPGHPRAPLSPLLLIAPLTPMLRCCRDCTPERHLPSVRQPTPSMLKTARAKACLATRTLPLPHMPHCERAACSVLALTRWLAVVGGSMSR